MVVERSDFTPVSTIAGLFGRGKTYSCVLKRVLDLVVVVASLPMVLPLVGILALLVRSDGGPAFYVQDRVGRGGVRFRLWKIRTMVLGADRILAEHLAADHHARAEWTAKQKLKNDPRVTRVGRFLRKSSLDELPQLLNVLRGDMSLVGPRPMLPSQLPLYPGRAYYALRPGITGPWQVSARNAVGFAARASFDADYLSRLSFKADVAILLRTVGTVCRGSGC